MYHIVYHTACHSSSSAFSTSATMSFTIEFPILLKTNVWSQQKEQRWHDSFTRYASLLCCWHQQQAFLSWYRSQLFSKFTQHPGGIKGIGGTTVTIMGSRMRHIKTKADDSSTNNRTIMGTVHIPLSPYNFILLQLMLKLMKQLGLQCKMARHNDFRDIF